MIIEQIKEQGYYNFYKMDCEILDCKNQATHKAYSLMVGCHLFICRKCLKECDTYNYINQKEEV